MDSINYSQWAGEYRSSEEALKSIINELKKAKEKLTNTDDRLGIERRIIALENIRRDTCCVRKLLEERGKRYGI